MRDATFFTKPEYDWQRRYEALRASFVDQLPAKVIADRFDEELDRLYQMVLGVAQKATPGRAE